MDTWIHHIDYSGVVPLITATIKSLPSYLRIRDVGRKDNKTAESRKPTQDPKGRHARRPADGECLTYEDCTDLGSEQAERMGMNWPW